MSWRPAVTEDDHAIVKMCAELNREDPGPRPVPEKQTWNTLIELRMNPLRGAAWVLELGGSVVGYCLLITFWSNEVGGEIATVDEIFVKKELRGQGHGKEFFELLISEKKFRAIDLEVTPANRRARKFYESLGFTPLKNTHMRVRF
jgi:diamine N-acetyltransferase